MDDLELEAELKSLQPRRLPPRLSALIATANTKPPSTVVEWRRWTVWSCAAGLLFGLTSLSLKPPPMPAVTQTTAEVQTVPIGDTEEGLVSLPDGTAIRRYRVRSAEVVTWRDPATNASLRWIVPREDVHIEPVHFY